MRKLLISLLLVILCAGCLTACCESSTANSIDSSPKYGPNFYKIEDYQNSELGHIDILVDKNTRIMYMWIDKGIGDSRAIALSVIYDSDGKPMKYQGVISE